MGKEPKLIDFFDKGKKSIKQVPCPKCGGAKCDFCGGIGSVSDVKAKRYKK